MIYFTSKVDDEEYEVSDVQFRLQPDLTVRQVYEEFEKFLLAIGYQQESLDTYFEERAEKC